MSDNLTEQQVRARKLFSGVCEFKAAVSNIKDFHEFGLPEIAFVGRSNVGKSSLINALLRRKALARTSHTPGRTQTINFFQLENKMILTDLPGYGYAKVSKGDRYHWRQQMLDYLMYRNDLRRVFLLVDARRGLKDSDREMMALLDEAAVTYQIVLTKRDKIKKSDLEDVYNSVKDGSRENVALHPDIVVTSSHKSVGIQDLQLAVAEMLE